MKSINYLDILKSAWKITWNNRFLWWFGFFLTLGGGGINWDFNLSRQAEKTNVSQYEIKNFLYEHFYWIIIVAFILLILILALAALRVIAQAGIIKSVNRLEKKELASFSRGFREGKKYFWKLLFLGIILFLAIISLIIAVFLPVIFLFLSKAYVGGILMALVAMIIIIPLAILFAFVKKYAYFYVVLSDLGIRESLENAYSIFRKNMLTSVIMGLLFIPLGALFTLALIIILLTLSIPFIILGVIVYALSLKIILILVAAVLIAILLFAFLLAQSIYQTFYQSAWYLFFQQIAAEKTKKEVKEEVVIIKKIVDPESA